MTEAKDGEGVAQSRDGQSGAAWRPIATARMDGRRILLWNGHWPDFGSWDGDPEAECWLADDGERIEPQPTHWMPLPDPPTDDRR